MSVSVEPATMERWDDVVRVFGRRGDDPSWCWCRRFLAPSPGDDNRGALHLEVAQATTPPGLIAYVDGEPVGWTRVGPRADFPLVERNRALARVLVPDPDVWWVTCVVVAQRHRRSGIGATLLEAAVAFAAAHGATAVQGHPVDVAALKSTKVSPSALFTGTLTMFLTANFQELTRTAPTRPVMHHPLVPLPSGPTPSR